MLPPLRGDTSLIATEATDTIATVLVRVLKSFPGLEIVDANASALAGVGLSDAELVTLSLEEHDRIARHFGAEFAIRVGNRALPETAPRDHWVVSVAYRDRQGSVDRWDTSTALAPSVAPNGWPIESQAAHLAREIYAYLFPERAAAVWETVITDTRKPAAERLRALRSIDPTDLSPAAIASIVEMAPLTDTASRVETWTSLAKTRQLAAARPLTDALLYDAEPDVRSAAAEGLRVFNDVATVTAALESAAVGDASGAVRTRARMASMPDAQRTSYVAAALRDTSRSVEQRIAPLLLTQNSSDAPLSWELLGILDRIARRDADPALRIVALKEFGNSGEPRWLTSLVDALHNDPESSVRSAAIAALYDHRERVAAATTASPFNSGARVRTAIDNNRRTYTDALVKALASDPDASIRWTLARRLASEIASPGVLAGLDTAFRAETDDRVKAAIASALARANDAAPAANAEQRRSTTTQR